MRQTVKLARLSLTITAAASVSFAVGCGGASVVQQGPSDTLRAYAEALEQGRADDAYRLLSDDAKRGLSLEAFRRAVKENPQDTAEIARAMARPTSDPLITATVTAPSGVFQGGRWRIDASAVDLYGQATPRQAITGFLRAFERRRYDVILRYVPDAEREGSRGSSEVADLGTAPDGGVPPPAATASAKPTDTRPAQIAPPGTVPIGSSVGSGGQLTAEKIKAAWEGAQKDQINRIVQAIKTALPTAQIEETGDSAAMPYGAGGTVAFVREHGVWKIRDF
jgi:hypothetical protein